jgi:putative DNA primase/helicase
LQLIPFVVSIPKEKQDITFKDRLAATELPQILQWMIDGAVEWKRIGLSPPKKALDATEEYLKQEDDLLNWMKDRCVIELTATAGSADLYKSFKSWADMMKAPAVSQKEFSQTLEARGFRKKDERRGAVFHGIRLKTYLELDADKINDPDPTTPF